MLRVRKNPGLDYRLCDQTVTIYHQMGAGENFSCTRTVFQGAFLDFRKNQTVDKTGSRETNAFLLVLPSGIGGRPVWAAPDAYLGAPETFTLSPKDKILLGEGPEIATREAWAAFLPAVVSGLVVVKDVDPKYFRGAVAHVEAGG